MFFLLSQRQIDTVVLAQYAPVSEDDNDDDDWDQHKSTYQRRNDNSSDYTYTAGMQLIYAKIQRQKKLVRSHFEFIIIVYLPKV